jgi:S1-C subfamily serine protease
MNTQNQISTACMLLLAVTICSALPRDNPFPGTADYFSKNELNYLNTRVTAHVEEGISEIPQVQDKPIDESMTFFGFQTVDAESHKRGGVLYVAFPNEQKEEVKQHFDKFPERTRALTGILKKSSGGTTLYLQCTMPDQQSPSVGSNTDGSQHARTDQSAEFEVSDEVKKAAITSTVIIRSQGGGGSGFVVEDAGQIFIVTNQHVLLGVDKDDIEISTTGGTKLKPLGLQIVPELDLARIEVKEAPPPLTLGQTASIDEVVATVGNSLNAGVVTLNFGRIKGIGGTDIEVDCTVVPGQSGGPLINSVGEVLGVTTYSLRANKDSTTEGTRYAERRYFAVRLNTDTEWTPVTSWVEYSRLGALLISAEEIFEHAVSLALITDMSPKSAYQYDGRNQNLIEATRYHNRFAEKMTRMVGTVGTERDLRRNNTSLATDYRAVYRALIKASNEQETAVRRLMAADREKRYPWLHEQAEQLAKMFYFLSQSLEGQSNAKPNFLTW